MKKSIKNTIMIGMAAVLIGTSAVTISYAKDGKGANGFSPPSFSQQSSGNQSSSPFENFSNDGNNQNGGFGKNQTPGNQQNGSSSEQPQPPSSQQNDSSSQQQQPPGNQQNDSGSQQSQSSQSSDSNTQSSSSAANTSLSVETLAAEDASASNTAKQHLPQNSFKHKETSIVMALCYMFAALQIAIILAILAYLIISKFNEISFNEVLANMRKCNNKEV